MELSIRERIILLGILPKEDDEGKVTILRIVKHLRDDLGFSEEEIKEYEIIENGGNVKWKETGYLKEVPIGEKATDIIANIFKEMDNKDKMKISILDVYDKFVKG